MHHTKAVAVLSLLIPSTLYAKGLTDRDDFADHVLLVSIDGLHALDVARFVESHPHSAMATLAGPMTAAAGWLRWAGGVFLLWCGIRLLLASGRTKPSAPQRAAGGWFFSAFLLTLGNPMTILAFAAMFGSLGVAGTAGRAVTLVAGVFLGSMAWWTILSTAVAAAAGKLGGAWFKALDRVCGCTLVAFGLHAFLRR